MLSQAELAAMTVVELRRHAKDEGIVLGVVSTKSAIIERILAEQQEKQDAAPQQSERRAMIIVDDEGEDAPAPRAARPLPAAAPVRPATTSTGKNKPVFSLAGAKAWHNPQPFSASAQPSKYQPQLGQPLTTNPAQQGADGAGSLAPQRPLPRVSRFGPDAAKPAEAAPSPAPMIPPGYRPAAFAQPQTGASRFSGVQTTLSAEPPAAPAAAGYRRPLPDQAASEPAPVRAFLPRLREPGLNPAVPEMLAAGDVGEGAGVLEVHPDGYGFLRAGNFLPGKSDVYVSNAQIRRFNLRSGDYVAGKTRPQREGDRYAAMLYITSINGVEADEQVKHKDFDELTPVYPNQRIKLSGPQQNDPVLRFIDLFAPIGLGQRALIVAPPKAGKTTILKKIAQAIRAQHKDLQLMMLLVDERPEEVTDLKESIGGDVFYSTFDEPAESHARVSDLVIERAMRLVEQGRDVVILMDSLTRLSRAYNTTAPNTSRIMSGGLVAGALNRPKRFFGAARKLKEGGSLTIIATAIVETGSRMDDVIYEEFKGTGNMELTLDRALQELRLFPAVSIVKSGTRHEELLLSPEEMDVATKVRAMIAGASEQEGISLVLSMMEKTRDNDDFVARFDNWAKLMNGGRK
ncbi:MAG: transcription termination factor Rho [Christensenellales bacterium]